MKTGTCKLHSSVFWNISAKMSSKLILTISSFQISKLVRFLRHSLYMYIDYSLYESDTVGIGDPMFDGSVLNR